MLTVISPVPSNHRLEKNYNSPIRLEITVLLTSNCYINNGGLIDFLRYLASCKTQPGSSIVYKINNLK